MESTRTTMPNICFRDRFLWQFPSDHTNRQTHTYARNRPLAIYGHWSDRRMRLLASSCSVSGSIVNPTSFFGFFYLLFSVVWQRRRGYYRHLDLVEFQARRRSHKGRWKCSTFIATAATWRGRRHSTTADWRSTVMWWMCSTSVQASSAQLT